MNKNNKNIFQVSIGLNHEHPEVQSSIHKMRKLNPEWNYNLITTKKEMDSFMVENFKNSSSEFENNVYTSYIEVPKLLSLHKRGNILGLVAQCDIYRLAVVYMYGGLYLDIDSEIHGDFNKLLNEDAIFILTPVEVWNGCFYASSRHPIFKKLLNRILYKATVIKDTHLMSLTSPHLHLEVACRLVDPTVENIHDIIDKKKYIDLIPNIHNIEDHKIMYASPDFFSSNSISLKICPYWKKFLYKNPNDSNSPFNEHWHL